MKTDEVLGLAMKSDIAQFYSIAEVVKITGLSRISIYRRVKDKTLSAVKLGRRVLIPVQAINELKQRAVLLPEEGDK